MLTEERPVATTVARSGFDHWWLVAVGSVMLAVVAASLYTPDMVTGSAHEHIPIAAMIDWFWGALAIGYLSFVRRDADHTLLCVNNLSQHAQPVELDLSAYCDRIPRELMGGRYFPTIREHPYFLSLGSYEFLWFALEAGPPASEV